MNQEEFKQEEIEVFNCPNCSGNMNFDVKTQNLKCPNCETEIPIESVEDVKEYSFEEICESNLADNWEDEVVSIHCESCGAEVVTNSGETATSCLYCGSSHIFQNKQTTGIRPEGVVPFKVDKQTANGSFTKWCKSKWLAPNDFQHLYQQKELKAVYTPYWTYDAKASSSYVGQGGKYYYKTVRTSNGVKVEQRINWYTTRGYITYNFDDVLVGASPNIHDKVLRKIEPFNTQEAKPYQSHYLSGYLAEHYTLGVKEGFDIAKQKMHETLEEKAKDDILRRYDTARVDRLSPEYQSVTYKHLLLPVWITTYYYKEKAYQCVINGESGKIDGEYPVSAFKVCMLIILAIVLLYVFVLTDTLDFLFY